MQATTSGAARKAASEVLARVYVVQRNIPAIPQGERERERLEEDVALAVQAARAGIEAEHERVLLEIARGGPPEEIVRRIRDGAPPGG